MLYRRSFQLTSGTFFSERAIVGQFDQFRPGSPEAIVAYVTAGIITVIRLGLAVLLVLAMMKFRDWKSRAQPAVQSFDSPYQNF
jgi:hypothetical protein